MSKCDNLAPRLYGLFTVLKLTLIHHSIASTLRDGLKIHLLFHVSRLQEILGFGNNTVTIETLVSCKDLASKPHVPEKIVNVKTKHLHSKTI